MKCSSAMVMMALAMLVAQPVFGMEVNVQSRLTFNAEEAKNRPVAKVITLLKDMLAQMEKEAEEDQEVYDKFVCWCETNDKEKTKSIADAEARIENLNAKIEELTALSSQLQTELKNLETETAKNQESLDKATAMRQKELAEFQAEEKDMLGAISALKSAVTVLGKHQGASSLLQLQGSTAISTGSATEMMTAAARVKYVMDKHVHMLKHVLTHSERKMVTTFLQSYAAPGMGQSYAPQSGQIFGILSSMKETFESNLATSQKDETANQKTYQDMKEAKDEEISAAQAMIDEKTQLLATTDAKNAQAKEDLTDTMNTLAADEEFLAGLKKTCAMVDAEWAQRSKTRALETEACSKALALLNSDEAHDLFGKTLGFMQTESAVRSRRRDQAAKVISTIAKTHKNPKLSALSYKVKNDAFAKVTKAIEDMVTDLVAEQKAEVKHKDFCVEEFNSNQLETERRELKKEDLEAKIEDLTMTIKSLGDAINQLNADIAEAKIQFKRAGEDREFANKDFQAVVADQRATQKLLGKALAVLESFYGKQAAFMQAKQPAGPPPPPGFKPYKKQNGGVLGAIAGIMDEAKAMEAEAIKGEEEAQHGYEEFVKETNDSIAAKTKDMINKSEEKSKAEEAKVAAGRQLKSTELELQALANYKTELHGSCDFTLKNFEIRQVNREEEIEALKQALAILAGAVL